MKQLKHIFIIISILLLASCGEEGTLENSIRNFKTLNSTISTGGLIESGGIAALKDNGFDIIIDGRTPPEGTAEEQKQAEANGMAYFNLPIDGRSIPTAHLTALAKILADNKDKKILIHCASGNRIGGLWADYQISQGVDFSTAMQQGKTMGMGGTLENWLKNKHKTAK